MQQRLGTQQNPPYSGPSTLATISSIALAILSYIPLQIIRLTGFIFSLFGESLQSRALFKLADKLYAIFIMHALINLLINPSMLCITRNIATKDVIWNEKDLKKAHEFNEFLKNKSIDLDERCFIGAKSDGICTGASLITIEEIIKSRCLTERDLINSVSRFQEGFPAEAAALQTISSALFVKDKKYLHEQLRNLEKTLKNNNESAELKIEFNKLTQKWEQSKNVRLKMIGDLIGLKMEEVCSEYQNIDTLKNGCYLLSHKLHSTVYLKFEYGTYFLDPTFGLLKCDTMNPLQTIEKHFQDSYGGLEMLKEELKIYSWTATDEAP